MRESPFPFLPANYFGLLIERDGRRVVVWQGGGPVEQAEEGSASDEFLAEVSALIAPLQKPGIKMADVARFLEASGFGVLGGRRFNFKSGELYWDAITLANEAVSAWEVREGILIRHGGVHPSLADEDWPVWEGTVARMNAMCKASRIIGVASLEAFANEVLSQRFPEEYQALEVKGHASPIKKLRRLAELQGLPADAPWLQCLESGLEPRRQIVHHKPGFVDDMGAPDDITPSEATDPRSVSAFLDCIDYTYEALFESFGLPVPPTHRPPERLTSQWH